MPAQVPAGFTRGPILFLGALTNAQAEEQLLQSFWKEGGGYGARILLIAASRADQPLAERYQTLFNEWETGSAQTLNVFQRNEANASEPQQRVNEATAILILGENPLRFASTFGGTTLAQAIRRANAQGRVVAGLGGCASVLCQHMIAYDTRQQLPRPLLHRQLIQFAPGLGIVNRLVLDGVANAEDNGGDRISRLLTAVAYNPFLIGVSLEADTSLVLYANGTLEVFGQHSALVIDGGQLSHTNLHEAEEQRAISMVGVQLHVLTAGYTFNLENRIAVPPPESDIPLPTGNSKAAF